MYLRKKIGFSIFILIWLMISHINIYSQADFINNGAVIKINTGSAVYLDGNFTNNSNGIIDLDGEFHLTYDWTNNGINNVFTNIEVIPDGTVFLEGTTIQNIFGTSPTHFENLTIAQSDKILQSTDNEVNGILSIYSVLDLNTNTFIIDNPSPNGIAHFNKYILSETPHTLGYGKIRWNIQNQIGIYEVPFGSGNSLSADLNLTLETVTNGQPNNGYIDFATYPTDYYNQPLPLGSVPFNNDIFAVADRYWIIDAQYTNIKPAVNIWFKYTNDDIDPSNNPYIQQDQLKAMRYNSLLATWADVEPKGESQIASNTVALTGDGISSFYGVAPEDFHEEWALVSADAPLADLLLPNAFTPNGDLKNQTYLPVFHPDFVVEEYLFIIFNRWGQAVFETTDPQEGWDGTFKNNGNNVPIGVYNWAIKYKGVNAQKKKIRGHVTLIR